MTMTTAAVWPDAGVLAWDSAHERPQPDGMMRYSAEGMAPALCAFPGGWAAAGGSYEVGMRAVGLLRSSGGGTLEELAERLAPELNLAVAAAMTEDYDPSYSQTVMLTVASGSLEAGMFQPATGLTRWPAGARVYIPPGVLYDDDALETAFDAFMARATPGARAYAVLRALAVFYERAAELTPALSGNLRVGLLQRHRSGSWESVALTAKVSWLRRATDDELTARLFSLQISEVVQ